MKGATRSEVPSALGMATLLGASSPKTTCKKVMIPKAMAWIRPSENPAAASTGSSSEAIAGSPKAQAQRGDGDAELAHGEVGVELAGGLLEEPRRAPALPHEPVHLRGADLHEPELGCHEQAVQSDQKKRQDTRRPSRTRPLKTVLSGGEPSRAPRGTA
jgi:hypothetical protein